MVKYYKTKNNYILKAKDKSYSYEILNNGIFCGAGMHTVLEYEKWNNDVVEELDKMDKILYNLE